MMRNDVLAVLVAAGVTGGLAATAPAVSVDVTDDSRQVVANLIYNGVADSDVLADAGNPLAGLAEVLVEDEARSRATQLSNYQPLSEDVFAIRSRNRVGFETLLGFGAGDTAEGDALSAFRVTFNLVEALAYDLSVSGSAPVEGDLDVTGDYIVRLQGEGVDVEFRQDPVAEQTSAGVLQPGSYTYSVLASIAGNGAARVPVEVDGQLLLSAIDGGGDDDGGPEPGPVVIPTPAAGLAGGGLLLGLLVRRRRQ